MKLKELALDIAMFPIAVLGFLITLGFMAVYWIMNLFNRS